MLLGTSPDEKKKKKKKKEEEEESKKSSKLKNPTRRIRKLARQRKRRGFVKKQRKL